MSVEVIWVFIAVGVAAVWGWVASMYRQWLNPRRVGMVHVKFTGKQMRQLEENVKNIVAQQRREMGWAYVDEEDADKKPDWLTR